MRNRNLEGTSSFLRRESQRERTRIGSDGNSSGRRQHDGLAGRNHLAHRSLPTDSQGYCAVLSRSYPNLDNIALCKRGIGRCRPELAIGLFA